MTDAPKNPVDALEAEVGNAVHGYEWTYGGEKFTAKPQFDMRAIAAFQRGNVSRGLDLIFGKEQTEQILAVDTDEPLDAPRLDALLTKVAQHQGTTLGESTASTGS